MKQGSLLQHKFYSKLLFPSISNAECDLLTWSSNRWQTTKQGSRDWTGQEENVDKIKRLLSSSFMAMGETS